LFAISGTPWLVNSFFPPVVGVVTNKSFPAGSSLNDTALFQKKMIALFDAVRKITTLDYPKLLLVKTPTAGKNY
jgi:hypothetical protein